jgi:hypothetical protein
MMKHPRKRALISFRIPHQIDQEVKLRREQGEVGQMAIFAGIVVISR